MKIIKFLKKSGVLIKVVSETIKNETKEQKGGLLDMLFSKLGASLLGNLLAGKGVKAKIPGRAVKRAGKGTIEQMKEQWEQVKERLEQMKQQ